MADTDDKDKDKNEVNKMTGGAWAFVLILSAICAIPAILFWLLSDYILLVILFLPMVVMVVLGALNVKT